MSNTRTGSKGDFKRDLTVDELEILLEIGRIVTSDIDLDEILQSVHSYLPRLIPHTKSGIFFYQENTGKITIFAENISNHFLFKQQLKTKQGWRSTDIYTVEEIKRLQYFQSALRRDGILYTIGAPIILEGNFIGTIHLTRPESRRDFSVRDLRMLELVAQQIGIAVKNALTYEKGLSRLKDSPPWAGQRPL